MDKVSNSVHKMVTVNATAEEAFRVFTEGFDSWWPRGHKLGDADLQRAVIEPFAGGRWYEVDVDGTQCEWGRVLTWDPPIRVVLVWQINGQWRHDPELVTEVEVRFTEEDGPRTRVDLEHRNLDRFGADQDGVRAQFEAPDGWQGLMNLYAARVVQRDAAH